MMKLSKLQLKLKELKILRTTRSNVVVHIFQKQKLFVIEVLKKMLLPIDWLLLMQFEMDLLLTGVQMSQKKDRRNNLLLDCMVGKHNTMNIYKELYRNGLFKKKENKSITIFISQRGYSHSYAWRYRTLVEKDGATFGFIDNC